MGQSTTIAAVSKVARRLEALLDSIRESDPAYVAEMRHRFMLEVHDAVDSLDAIAQAGDVPALAGGSPAADVDAWPSSLDPDLDGFRWEPTFEGPLPLAVLAESAPAFSPTAEDWEAMYAAGRDGLVTEHDLAACGLAVG